MRHPLSPHPTPRFSTFAAVALFTLVLGFGLVWAAGATEPCGDFGECKALIEINSSDGDIGFHFLFDGDELQMTQILDPERRKIYQNRAQGALREQTLTENFAESAEPLCWNDPEADPDEEVVTLTEFLARWMPGVYAFRGKGEGGEVSWGATLFTYFLPAAPTDVDFDGAVISWAAGDDLGRCASFEELNDLVAAGVLPVHPRDVALSGWEIVLEPDVEDGDPVGDKVFSIRVPASIAPREVTVPADYLASLPVDTPVKVEVGAIELTSNATFTEEDGFCVNEDEGCEDED